MQKRVQVWRRSTGERLPDPLPESLVKMNPDLTTKKPATEKVMGCCGEGLIDAPPPADKTPLGRKEKKNATS